MKRSNRLLKTIIEAPHQRPLTDALEYAALRKFFKSTVLIVHGESDSWKRAPDPGPETIAAGVAPVGAR
ncbi:MAG: hypothetical protein WBN90_11390, partial [Gammaproteobacteria bacterium]